VRGTVNSLGDVAVRYRFAILAFTIQSIAISISHFTELRAPLSVAICTEIFVDKKFSAFYFPHYLCYSS